MKERKEIKEAVEKLDNLSEDERMQRIADLREKAILDEKAIYAKGLDDGIKEGLEKGIKEGKQKEKLERYSRNINSKNIDKSQFL